VVGISHVHTHTEEQPVPGHTHVMKLDNLITQPQSHVHKKKKRKKTSHGSFEHSSRRFVDELFGVAPKKIVDVNGNPFDQYPDDYDATIKIDEDNEFDLVKLVGKAVDPLTGVPRNIKLPEGDFKEAKNFFDFCSNFRGPDSKFPFSRQMWLMLSLFAEMCPRCTPKARLKNIMNTPVDMDGREMSEFLQLTEYGVCPKCGGHKSEFIRNHELNEYVEMNLCIGQRAGKSTTTASGVEYLTHKYVMYPKLAGICRGVSSATPLVFTFVALRFSDAATLLWKPVLDGINNSPWFCLEENTQITLLDGSTKAIKDMQIGDQVPTLEGPSVVDNVFDNGVRECKKVVLDDGKSVTGTDDHQIRCLSEDGQSLVWKKISELTEDDYVMTE